MAMMRFMWVMVRDFLSFISILQKFIHFRHTWCTRNNQKFTMCSTILSWQSCLHWISLFLFCCERRIYTHHPSHGPVISLYSFILRQLKAINQVAFSVVRASSITWHWRLVHPHQRPHQRLLHHLLHFMISSFSLLVSNKFLSSLCTSCQLRKNF